METAVRSTSSSREGRRTPAQLYLWIWGALLVVLGGGSLLLHPDFSLGDEVTERHLFGVIETNGWHGMAGLTAGVASLAFAPSRRWSPLVAVLVGVVGGVIPGLVFLVSGDDSVALGAVPVDLVDTIALHLVPGALGVLTALASRRAADGPVSPAPTR